MTSRRSPSTPATIRTAWPAEVARSHAVTALIQSAAKARIQGDTLRARAMLSHAYQIDPRNPELAPHLGELVDNPLPDDLNAQREHSVSGLGEMERLLPAPGTRNFHFRHQPAPGDPGRVQGVRDPDHGG